MFCPPVQKKISARMPAKGKLHLGYKLTKCYMTTRADKTMPTEKYSGF